MYGTGTTRRQEGAKADAAKRKRDAGPDTLDPQIRALAAMDEALNTDNDETHNNKGQEERCHRASCRRAIHMCRRAIHM